MRKASVLLVFLTLSAHAAWAQSTGYKRFLVPTVLPQEGVPGANGSLWVSHFLLRNNGPEKVTIFGYDNGCDGISPCAPPAPPGITFAPRVLFSVPPTYGGWLFVEQRYADQMSFSLRVQDATRQSGHFGTRIPVVPESDFRGALYLIGVPTTADYRSLLRIYGLSEGRVRVRYYAVDARPFPVPDATDRFLATSDYELRDDDNFIALAVAVPQFGEPLVAISVEALDGEKIWAFASVTHNQTQNVTVVAP